MPVSRQPRTSPCILLTQQNKQKSCQNTRSHLCRGLRYRSCLQNRFSFCWYTCTHADTLKTSGVAAGFGRHGMPPPASLTVWPWNYGVRVASKAGNLPSKFGHARPLGFRIIRYVRDGRTDRRTDKSNAYCLLPYGREHNNTSFRCRVWQCLRVVAVSAVVWFTLLVILCWQPRWWALSFEQHFKYVKPGTVNLVPRFTAGCCHLANLTLQWAH